MFGCWLAQGRGFTKTRAGTNLLTPTNIVRLAALMSCDEPPRSFNSSQVKCLLVTGSTMVGFCITMLVDSRNIDEESKGEKSKPTCPFSRIPCNQDRSQQLWYAPEHPLLTYKLVFFSRITRQLDGIKREAALAILQQPFTKAFYSVLSSMWKNDCEETLQSHKDGPESDKAIFYKPRYNH